MRFGWGESSIGLTLSVWPLWCCGSQSLAILGSVTRWLKLLWVGDWQNALQQCRIIMWCWLNRFCGVATDFVVSLLVVTSGDGHRVSLSGLGYHNKWMEIRWCHCTYSLVSV